MRNLFSLFAAVLIFGSASSQENIVPRKFGIGLNITQFRFADIYSYNFYSSPANSIMLEWSPMKNFRLTPSFAYFSQTVQTVGPDYNKYDEKTSLVAGGLGLFYMFQKQDVNFYTGLRFEYARIKDDFYLFDYVSNPNPPYNYYYSAIPKSRIDARTSINPTLGAEYFFSEHFSIGAEFQLRMLMFDKVKDIEPGLSDEEKFMISTDAGIQFRFYF